MTRTSIINGALRYYLQDESLKKFYGGYRDYTTNQEKYYLGIGEIAGTGLDPNASLIQEEFLRSTDIDKRITKYSGTMGDQQTNALMADHLNKILGVDWFSDSDIINCDGVQNALSITIKACIAPIGTPEDSRQYLLLPTPCYPYFPTIASTYTGVVAFLAYSPDELVEGIKRNMNGKIGGILLNIPHNPLGYALDEEHVKAINKVAEDWNCAIILDMVYSQTPLDLGAVKLLGKFNPDRTVFLDSFSKKYGLPGLRIGFVAAANQETAVAIRSIKAGECICTSMVKVVFAGYLLSKYPEVPGQIADAVRQRFTTFLNLIGDLSPYGITMLPQEIRARQNAFYLPLFVEEFLQKTGMNIHSFLQMCFEKYNLILTPDIRMYPPDKFPGRPLEYTANGSFMPENQRVVFTPGYQEGKKPFIRISFGAEPRIEEAAERFLAAVREG